MRLIAVFLACFPTIALAQEGMRDGDRLLPVDEMKRLLSGNVVEFYDGSKSRYSPEGTYGYTYTDDGPVWRGEYTIAAPSAVCVDFENGSARCDFFVDDGARIVLITTDGLRFPVRNITVDAPGG